MGNLSGLARRGHSHAAPDPRGGARLSRGYGPRLHGLLREGRIPALSQGAEYPGRSELHRAGHDKGETLVLYIIIDGRGFRIFIAFAG